MEKLNQWSSKRESIQVEMNFVTSRADEKGLNSVTYECLRSLAACITDTMFAFACAEVNGRLEKMELLAEDVEKTSKSLVYVFQLTKALPEKYERLKARIARLFAEMQKQKRSDVIIPKLFRMVGEIETLAADEKRVILET